MSSSGAGGARLSRSTAARSARLNRARAGGLRRAGTTRPGARRGRTPRIARRNCSCSSSSPWLTHSSGPAHSVYWRALASWGNRRARMKILISNDDGYRAEGITRLREALSGLAEVTVVAPDRNRSGASNSLTLDLPLRVTQSEPGVYFVAGTPTDCVHLAVSGLFDFTFDMAVSGGNDGPNLGDDVLYSGTVAAAIEGRVLGLPPLARSRWTGPGAGPPFAAGRALARREV